MDVVLADGRFVHVTPTSYPDLYYALRGAADSIGIITTFHLQTQPAPAHVVSYSSSNVPVRGTIGFAQRSPNTKTTN
jgi:FAD/FMN-containing dehydrogenase